MAPGGQAMNDEKLSLKDLRHINADDYTQGCLTEAAEVLMEAAADFVDMLIKEEHYKIEYALRKIGMSAEQYVAVRSKNEKKWWKNRDEIEDEMKGEEAAEEEAGKTNSDPGLVIDTNRKILLPIWEKVKNGTINWQEELDNAKDNKTFAAILDYKNSIERSESENKVFKTLDLAKNGYLTFREVLECYPEYVRDEVKKLAKKAGIDLDREIAAEDRNYEQYSGRLKKTLAFCKEKDMSLEEILEFFKENTHWIIRRCAKEIGYEDDAVKSE